jgi:hypothetical protein
MSGKADCFKRETRIGFDGFRFEACFKMFSAIISSKRLQVTRGCA